MLRPSLSWRGGYNCLRSDTTFEISELTDTSVRHLRARGCDGPPVNDPEKDEQKDPDDPVELGQQRRTVQPVRQQPAAKRWHVDDQGKLQPPDDRGPQ